jgi:hypothetical protein
MVLLGVVAVFCKNVFALWGYLCGLNTGMQAMTTERATWARAKVAWTNARRKTATTF